MWDDLLSYNLGGGEEIISFTINDYNNDGIHFGNAAPGETDHPADWGDSLGTITLTVGAETNVDVNVRLKGDDFNGPSTISIDNVKYDDDSDPGGADTMSNFYDTWYAVTQPLATDDVRQVYHWISIPAGKEDGAYNSTFYYQAVKQ